MNGDKNICIVYLKCNLLISSSFLIVKVFTTEIYEGQYTVYLKSNLLISSCFLIVNAFTTDIWERSIYSD